MKVLWEEKWSAKKNVQSRDWALQEIREKAAAIHENDEPHTVEAEVVDESDQHWEVRVRGIAIEPEKPSDALGCDACQYFIYKSTEKAHMGDDEMACINPIVAIREQVLEETGEIFWAFGFGLHNEVSWPTLMLKKKRETCPFCLAFAGGQGDVAHPDSDPTPDCKTCINHKTCTWEAEGKPASECQDYMLFEDQP